MPKTYELADHTVREMCDRVMAEHHPTLHAAHVSVAILMVRAPTDDEGVPTSNAITVHGQPAKACIRITSLKERALGLADAVMEIDAYRWEQMDEEEQEGLIDHELMHLVATIGDDEARTVKSDACDRPVLTTRKHDVIFEGFAEVMKRRGRAAPERELLESTLETFRREQLRLPGIASDDVETSEAAPVTKRKRSPARAMLDGEAAGGAS